MVGDEPLVARVLALVGCRERRQPAQLLARQRDAPQRDVIAVVLGEALGQIPSDMNMPARVEVADVEHDQRAAVVILGNVVDVGAAAEAVHRKEADSVVIEHRGEHAAHGAFLGSDLTRCGCWFQKSRR